MPETAKCTRSMSVLWSIVALILISVLSGSCNHKEKVFTVGICLHTSVHLSIVEGFKAGMAAAGYIEGKNIKYIFTGPVKDDQNAFEAEIKKLLSQKVDLLLTTGSKISLTAKKLVEGKGIPVVFCGSFNSVQDGLAESIKHPGGNLTGIQFPHTHAKLMELLIQIKPGIKKIYMPYNPDDNIIFSNMPSIDEIASKLDLELVVQKIHSVEETIAAIGALSPDTYAIYRIPSPTLDLANEALNRAAIKRGLPMGSSLLLDDSVLITLSADHFKMGQQAARLTDQIIRGAKPADLPVETSEINLIINLDTASKIGLHVPDGILAQANKIIH
jgi:putative tryptophan/tyrosine transport system substrate-binding protein